MDQLTLRKSRKALDNEREKETVKCKKCECSWFEEVAAKQFNKYLSIIPGSKLPTIDDLSFTFLRCMRCGDLHEPSVNISPSDALGSRYQSLLDQLENVSDKSKARGEKI